MKHTQTSKRDAIAAFAKKEGKRAVENMARGAFDAGDMMLGGALAVGDGILDFFIPRKRR